LRSWQGWLGQESGILGVGARPDRARSLAAGAHGYLTRDHATGPGRPALSEREHCVLMAYASGLTLESAARSLGISPETARTYLKRVKAKYRQIGLPVYTKLDLAQQAVPTARQAPATCRPSRGDSPPGVS
jgi:DNA-binding CsgD family transcriptional regulator